MYQINVKEQVLAYGVKVVREEKKVLIDDFYDYSEALTYLNEIYLKLVNRMLIIKYGKI